MPKRFSECLKSNRVAIVRTHDVYIAEDSMELSYKWACSLEQSAKIQWLAKQC